MKPDTNRPPASQVAQIEGETESHSEVEVSVDSKADADSSENAVQEITGLAQLLDAAKTAQAAPA